MRAAKWLKSVGSDERWVRLRCYFVVFERRSDSVMVPFAGCARYSSGGLEVGELLRLVVRHWLYAARSPEPVFASWPETTAKPGVNASRQGCLRVSPVHCFTRLFWGDWVWLQPPEGQI